MNKDKLMELIGKLFAIIVLVIFAFGFFELVNLLVCKALDIDFSLKYAYLIVAFIACNYAFPFKVKHTKND